MNKIATYEEYLQAECRAQEIFDSDDLQDIKELNALAEAMLEYDTTYPHSEVHGDDAYLPDTLRAEWQDLFPLLNEAQDPPD